MALDLGKVVYKKLEDGGYTIIPTAWTLKQTAGKQGTIGEDYVQLTCTLQGTDRVLSINLFEKGLGITAANVSAHLNLGEPTLAEVLEAMINKPLPAYHQTAEVNGQTYYNWYICSQPRPQIVVEMDGDGPAF